MNELIKEIESGLKGQDARGHPAENVLVDDHSQWDLEPFIDQIWHDLGGTASRSHIRRVLLEAAPAYENARIKAYVPILLRRDVLRQLEDELELNPDASVPIPKNLKKRK